MYVRHLTRVNRFLGGLSFGAHPNALDAIVNMTLNQLRDVADNCPGLLCCRLGKNPQAWSDLLKLARRNDGQPLLPAKILVINTPISIIRFDILRRQRSEPWVSRALAPIFRK